MKNRMADIARRIDIAQIIKFGIVGVINTLVYYATYYLLLQLGILYVIAATAGTIVGIINSFIWNKLFVFKAKQKTSPAEITKFLVVYGVQYLVNIGTIFICITCAGLSEELAGLIGTCICPFVSYFGLKFWGFRKKTEISG